MERITIHLDEFLGSTGSRYLVQSGLYIVNGLRGKDISLHTTRDLFKKITRSTNSTHIYLPMNSVMISDLRFPIMGKANLYRAIAGGLWWKMEAGYPTSLPNFSKSDMEEGMIWCSQNNLIFLWRKKATWLYHPHPQS